MSRLSRAGLLLAMLGGLAGCASSDSDSERAIAEAAASYHAIKGDTYVLRSAPLHVQRAGETLDQAERLAGYWGSGEDAVHYAYLSRRYSEIARLQSELAQSRARVEQQERTLERLGFALREAQLRDGQQGASLEEQMIGLAASETDRGLIMTLGDLLFETGQARLGASANRTLSKLARFLQLNDQRRVRIEGYTDSLGEADHNLALSRERAQAVADFLIDLGVEPARIEVVGYGEGFPLAENASNQGRAQNRRVEIVFSDAQGRLGPHR